MQTITTPVADKRYAKCIAVSKRIRWDIDRDVIRGRRFDFNQKFLPDGLSLVARLRFLHEGEAGLVSQIQGRTYANMFGLVERFIAAKVLDVGREHALGDQDALQALVRMGDEEIKHQELFRRIELMCAEGMPAGYTFVPEPNAVAAAVLSKSTWAVLALICHIELFVLAHYRESIDKDTDLSPLFKDVLFFHAREEAQHAILDELEWRRANANVSAVERDAGVDDLIALVAGVDDLLQMQAMADARFFAMNCRRELSEREEAQTASVVLAAYRWQYIVSGAQEKRFADILAELCTAAQMQRVGGALTPLAESTRWAS